MKLLYVGSICDNKIFEENNRKSKIKVSSAPQHFEEAILKGLKAQPNLDITCISAECTATYPFGKRLVLKKRTDIIAGNLTTEIASAINLPFLKPKMHAASIGKSIEKWLKHNADVKDKCVFLYGFYPKVAAKTFKLCKLYNCKCFVMITDLPAMDLTQHTGIKGYFKAKIRGFASKIQGQADGYVYITKQMADVIAPGKPYHVMEVLVDTDIIEEKQPSPIKRKALMYAGTLYKKYGTNTLIDVYEKLNTDYELWIFGSGDYEGEIRRKAEHNNRIKYFGVVSRDEIMRREQEASLLLNIRDPREEYTKYSFPSKMIEYMLSGTPVFTTKLPSFPPEYDQYLYYAEEYTQDALASSLKGVMSLSQNELLEKGRCASEFVRQYKNCEFQMSNMLDFIKQQL